VATGLPEPQLDSTPPIWSRTSGARSRTRWRKAPHVVQAIARHADLDVTLSIYAHTDLDAMREALDKIEWEIW